MMMMDD